MVKCPKGSPSQVKANLAYIKKQSALEASSDFPKGFPEKDTEALHTESEGSELDSIKADKRCPPTARDELVYFFISSFLDILVQSWDGKPCIKQKLRPHQSFVGNESEEYGEDLGPCELSIVSSTAEYLKELYQKRSSNLSKEKSKKDSESCESEYLAEEDFDSPESPDRWRTTNDEDVHFVLRNGVWYKGRVSRRLMEGEGYYFWEDGSSFQGDFEGGCATGKGRLEFPDLSFYEGGVYKGFRHGEGMFCFHHSPVMYSGHWWLGRKHGCGLIIYNDPKEGHNFYRGQWQDGEKEGFGFRQYPSGAKYIGFWSKGKRHGKGIMFWANHDIYRGDWKEGLMHGYGEYTWKGFVNKSLSYPANNTYKGYWEEGKRHGLGLFELKSGALIETTWQENMKDGPGAVICANGAVITSKKLFQQDRPVCDEEPELSEAESGAQRKEQLSCGTSRIRKSRINCIPINSPVQTLNLYPHTQKLANQLNGIHSRGALQAETESNFEGMTPKPSEGNAEAPPAESNSQETEEANLNTPPGQLGQMEKEDSLIRNYIILMINKLRDCYDRYAKLSCQKKPVFRCVLLRLFLWQMLIDFDIPNPRLSLVDIDNMLAGEEYLLMQDIHNPFERLQFWQFIQILLVLSWNLYGQFIYGEVPLVQDKKANEFLNFFKRCECKNVLKMAFQYFVEKHVVTENPNPEQKECRIEDSDFAPMEAMYVIYRNIGEPHSARDFVNALCATDDQAGGVPKIVRYFEKLPFYKVDGKNAFTVAGDLQHIPQGDMFNIPEIFELERQLSSPEPKSGLTCFNGLKARRVIKCLLEICPGIMVDGCIINMDHKLTFLEFYKTIVLCAKLQLKIKTMNEIRDAVLDDYKTQMEEYKKQMTEYEKQKENQVVSRKKSRQFSDTTKKGRK